MAAAAGTDAVERAVLPNHTELAEMTIQLSKKLAAIPADQQSLYEQFTAHVERILASNGTAPKNILGILHLLAAEGLLFAAEGLAAMEQVNGAETLSRIIRHLEGANADGQSPADSALRELIRRRRATAYIRFQNCLDPEEMAKAIGCLEDALSHAGSGERAANLGALAYNAAGFRLHLASSGGAEADRLKLEQLFRAALGHYQRASETAKAADASCQLARLALESLQDDETPEAASGEIFEDGWRFIHDSMAPISISDDPLTWAERSELAGQLLLRRPGFSKSTNSLDALAYLDRALNAYYQVGENSRATKCAVQLAEVLSEKAGSWDAELIERFLYYLDTAVAVLAETAAEERERAFLLASYCGNALSAGAHGSSEISERMRGLAEQAYPLAGEDEDLCAQAILLIGNSLLNSAESSALMRAAEAFERAAQYARAANREDQETKALRLLGLALCRRFVGDRKPELYAAAVDALEKAAMRSSGEERGVAYLNLASITLEAFQTGFDVSLDDARASAAKAWAAVDEIDPVYRPYMESQAAALDEFAFVVRPAMESAVMLFDKETKSLPQGFPPPSVLYFKEISHGNSYPFGGDGLCSDVASLPGGRRQSGRTPQPIASRWFGNGCDRRGLPEVRS